jgi:hypothetical protein
MSTPQVSVPAGRPASARFDWARRKQVWASLAIVTMWIAVLFDGIYGGDFVSTSSGGNTTTIPSAILVALFACIASIRVARYGFRDERSQD